MAGKMQFGTNKLGRQRRKIKCNASTFEGCEWMPNFKGSQRGCVLKVSNEYLNKFGVKKRSQVDSINNIDLSNHGYKKLRKIIQDNIKSNTEFTVTFMTPDLTVKTVEIFFRGPFPSVEFCAEGDGNNFIIENIPYDNSTKKLVDSAELKPGYRVIKVKSTKVTGKKYDDISRMILSASNDMRVDYSVVFEEGDLSWYNFDEPPANTSQLNPADVKKKLLTICKRTSINISNMWPVESIKDNRRDKPLYLIYNALCSRHRWGVEMKLFAQRLPVIVLCVLVQFAHSSAANYAYYRHIQSEPLRDIGFEFIPQINDSLHDISEYITLGIVISIFLISFISFFSSPPPVHWTSVIIRVITVMALCATIRCICFLSTGLPGPAAHCLLTSNSYDPPQTIYAILFRKNIFKGCGDLIFSSHTSVSMIFILALHTYFNLFVNKSTYYIILYGLYWPLLLFQVLFIIASRKHYTVDIIVALYTTPFLWNLSYRIIKDAQSELTLLYIKSQKHKHRHSGSQSMTKIHGDDSVALFNKQVTIL